MSNGLRFRAAPPGCLRLDVGGGTSLEAHGALAATFFERLFAQRLQPSHVGGDFTRIGETHVGKLPDAGGASDTIHAIRGIPMMPR